jgi:hypothetical protein
MEREARLQGILHISQKPHLSGSPVKEPSLKVPLMESLAQRDASPLQPSFIHLPKSTVYEPPPHIPLFPSDGKGPPWRARSVSVDFLNTLRTGIFFLYIYHRSLIRSDVTFLQTSGPEDHSEKRSMYCVMKCMETKRVLKTQICVIRLSQL